jgi:hypothetical protein
MATFFSTVSSSSGFTVLLNFSTRVRLTMSECAGISLCHPKPVVRRKAILFNAIALYVSEAEDELSGHRTIFGCLYVGFYRAGVFDCGPMTNWTFDRTVVAFLAGVPEPALDSGVREEGDRLAGPPGRREGFRRGRAARLRACPRGRSSNREGTWSARRWHD